MRWRRPTAPSPSTACPPRAGLGNHLTLSVPPSHDRFLVIRYGLHWMEVTAANLVLVHVNGTILEGEGPVQGAAVSLHAPMHRGYGRSARVIFHTHQPWSTALACVEDGGLAMYHPDAAMYYDEAGFDEVYTGNWPVGSRQGTVDEGTRLLHSPALRGKRVGFLANHGTLLLSETIEEAVFDAVHLERLAWQQVHAMQYGRLPRLGHQQVQSYRDRYMGEWQLAKWQHGRTLVESAAARVALAPLWNGTGDIPSSDDLCPGDEEDATRCKVALACRLFGRLNGHRQFEGIAAHFSVELSDGAVLVVPSDVPFESMRSEWLSKCSVSAPLACTGLHTVNYKAFERFSRGAHLAVPRRAVHAHQVHRRNGPSERQAADDSPVGIQLRTPWDDAAHVVVWGHRRRSWGHGRVRGEHVPVWRLLVPG